MSIFQSCDSAPLSETTSSTESREKAAILASFRARHWLYMDRSGRLYSTHAAERRSVPRWIGLVGEGDALRVTFDRMDDDAVWVAFYSCRWIGGVPHLFRCALAQALFERTS